MILPAHDLGSHVAWSPTGIHVILVFELSGDAQVSQMEIARGREDQVFGFDVPMYNFMGMEVLQSQEEAADEELGLNLCKSPSLPYVVAEVTSIQVIHKKIQILPILKGKAHVDQEGMPYFG